MDNKLGAINHTKLYWPPRPVDFVPRKRLQPQLDQIARQPLTLVSAPAGYGKSTTISAWLDEQEINCTWLSLDEKDNDLTLFLAHVLAAVRKTVPEFAIDLLSMVQDAGIVSVPAFMTGLDAGLDRLDKDVVLVLDDFQFIRDPDILEFIRHRMRHPHPSLHLVLVTRHDPLLPLVHWRARNQVVDIRSSHLRFSTEETAEFLHKATKTLPEEKVVEFLQASTEGWVAALRLATLSRVHEEADRANGYGSWSIDRDITSYLADQVLSRQPPEKQAFLLQSSVLESMCGSLCDAAIQIDGEAMDGEAMLRELGRENLFLIPISHDSEWYRYHHLFRDFLQERLRRHYSTEAINGLHMRASHWLNDKGYYVDAIRHALLAGDEASAVAIVAANRHELLAEHRWHQLDTWYRLFPERVVSSSPDLLLIRGWRSHFRQFDSVAVREVTRQVEKLLEHLDLDPIRAQQLLGENNVLCGLADYFELSPLTSIDLCRAGLQLLPQEHYVARSYAWLFWAASLQMTGDLSGALSVNQQGVREDLDFPGESRARSMAGAGFIHWMAADLEGVEHVGQNLVRVGTLHEQPQSLVWGYYFLASAHYHRNELDEALVHAQYTFDHRFAVHAHCAVQSGYIIASIHLATGDHKKAEETLTAMADYVMAVRSEPLHTLLEAMRADLALRRGQSSKAVHWAKQAAKRLPASAQPLFFSSHLVPAKIFLADDPSRHPELESCLQQLHHLFESTHNTRFFIELLALEALFYAARGEEEAAWAALGRSLALAASSDFIRLYVDLGPQMKVLLAEYARQAAPDDFLARVRAAFQATVIPAGNEAMVEPLTDRECEVLELLAKRFSNKEIAQELVIAEATVKRHTINIYQKLGVRGRHEAVTTGKGLGLLQ